MYKFNALGYGNNPVKKIFRVLMIILGCVSLLTSGASCSESKAVSGLKVWLEGISDIRFELATQKFACIPLSESEAREASELLWQDKLEQLRKDRTKEWEGKELNYGEYKMPLEYKKFGDTPEEGRSLYISMHGGGNAPAKVNDQQWENQKTLYDTPPGSIYVAPRAPTNDWDLWHKAHIDEFFQRIIEDCIAFENVNPNKVYIMGYSAGGDGVYQLAPRMADRLAAAAMMAGHPNETVPLGLRNIGFTLWCGELDGAYNRNKISAEWGDKLAKLHEEDPEGYIHEVHIQEGMGHWMKRTDAAAIEWMDKFVRDPFPNKIVWKQDDVTHERFYWLGVPSGTAQARAEVVAERKGQTITILKAEKVDSLIIRLNDEMCDLDKRVTVKWDGQTVFEGKVSRTIKTIADSLDERADPDSIFYAEIRVLLEPGAGSQKSE